MNNRQPPFAEPRCVAKLIRIDPGLYLAALAGTAGESEGAPGLSLPAVQLRGISSGTGGVTIVDRAGRTASWLQGATTMLLLTAREAAVVVATAYCDRNADSPPLWLTLRRLTPASDNEPDNRRAFRVVEFDVAAAAAAPGPPRRLGFEVVAHIRRHGDVRFADPSRVGPLGPGLWIEALTLLPSDPALPIEYKALAANGVETPWVGCGSPCGTRGQGIPLIAFAMRQQPASGAALFDCEYTGHFGSGRIVGPVGNGAPCRSPVAGDPLEGIELRLVAR